MEDNWEQWNCDNVINELIQGRELARQLQVQLNMPSSSSYEIYNILVQNILVSYEKALSLLMLNWSNSPLILPTTTITTTPSFPATTTTITTTPSFPATTTTITTPSFPIPMMLETTPNSVAISPMNKYHDHDHHHKPPDHNLSINSSWNTQRWMKQVRLTPGVGLEDALDDGFNWRKYGQKHIIGSKFLRGYYKCTLRNVEGCLSTKQVQRSDEDSNIIQVAYSGVHTCSQASFNSKHNMKSFSSFNFGSSTEENDGLLGSIMNRTNYVNVGETQTSTTGFEQI